MNMQMSSRNLDDGASFRYICDTGLKSGAYFCMGNCPDCVIFINSKFHKAITGKGERGLKTIWNVSSRQNQDMKSFTG